MAARSSTSAIFCCATVSSSGRYRFEARKQDFRVGRAELASPRLFYERAADAGEARAALRLGNTFDPAFLDFAHLRGRGDSAMAVSWYGGDPLLR
jgi:hypothetical protein